MKKTLQRWMARIGAFLDRLGEDYDMDFTIEDMYYIDRLNARNDRFEEGLFA